MIVEGAKQALLPKKIPIQSPERQYGKQGDMNEVDTFAYSQQNEERNYKCDTPALHSERITCEAIDYTLYEFEVL